MRITLSVLFACLLLHARANAEESPPADPPPKPAWEWTKRDLQELATLERKVTQSAPGAPFELSTASWKIETYESARFTAEAGLFMERSLAVFQKVIPGKVRAKLVTPTLLVCPHADAYKQASGSSSPATFRYSWDWYKKWTTFHCYTFLPESPNREFLFFPHRHLQAEAARAGLQLYLGQVTGVPDWLSIGLRRFFSAWDLQQPVKVNLAEGHRWQRSPRLAALARFADARSEDMPKLAHIVGNKSSSTHDHDDDNLQVALAESFIDFLVRWSGGAKIFDQMWNNLTSKAEGTPPLDEADIAKLEPHWHRHLQKLVHGAEAQK